MKVDDEEFRRSLQRFRNRENAITVLVAVVGVACLTAGQDRRSGNERPSH